jgi:methionyl-tRNA synthetase
MPIAAGKLWDSLGAEEYLGALDAQPVAQAGEFGQLKPGTKVTKGEALFPRLEETA